jgi:hypothetical protein
MPQFLYFVPTDRPGLTPKDLRAAGLGYLGIKHNPPARLGAGPEQKNGIVFAADGKSPAAYKPAEQTWLPGPDGKYFVGRANAEEPPGPDDLNRLRFVDGEPILLPDERTWTVPICRSIVRGSTLPEAIVLGADGKTWTMKELPEFTALCRVAERLWAQWWTSTSDGADAEKNVDIEVGWEESVSVAVDALGVNYRLGPVEASSLGLLTSESVGAILRAIIDLPELTRVARQKKHPRYVTYRRWRDGLLPGYVPTFADLTWYAEESRSPGSALEQLAGLLQTLGVARVNFRR